MQSNNGPPDYLEEIHKPDTLANYNFVLTAIPILLLGAVCFVFTLFPIFGLQLFPLAFAGFYTLPILLALSTVFQGIIWYRKKNELSS